MNIKAHLALKEGRFEEYLNENIDCWIDTPDEVSYKNLDYNKLNLTQVYSQSFDEFIKPYMLFEKVQRNNNTLAIFRVD